MQKSNFDKVSVAIVAKVAASGLTMCCLPSLNVMQAEGRAKVSISYDPLELLKFLNRDFLPMNLMCERAGMFEARIFDRTKALFEYYGLPFDADPPPPEGN